MNLSRILLFFAPLLLVIACNEAPPPESSEPKEKAYTMVVINPDLPSPRKEMSGSIDSVDIRINYGSPYVRNRQIWGGLEPYDKVWRAGANEATAISFSENVLVEGQPLPAGRYGFFSIPTKGNWTLIFNADADQWGSFEYDENKDVLRVEVSPQTRRENAEQLDYVIEAGAVAIRWEKVFVPFSVKKAE